MGVYDFFKGTCPVCHNQVDNHPEYGKCGDIQTKYFVGPEPEDCFRNFRPGHRVPFPPGKDLVVGKTCCCDTLIKAVFDGDLLLRYEEASQEEKDNYDAAEQRTRQFWQTFTEKIKQGEKTEDLLAQYQTVQEQMNGV
jgi:hypothetical protein